MPKKIQLLIAFIAFSLIACNEERKEIVEKDKSEIKAKKEKELDSLNNIATEKLIENYKALNDWDATEQFTYTLQEKFIKNRRPIAFIGYINDIVIKDSVYILRVLNNDFNLYENHFAQISVNQNDFKKLEPFITTGNYFNNACFIFLVTAINSHLPTIKSDIEKNGEDIDDVSSSLVLDYDKKTIEFKGILIDYYFYKKLKEDE